MNEQLVSEFFENEVYREIHIAEGKEVYIYVYDLENKNFGNIKVEKYGKINELEKLKNDFVERMGEAKENQEKSLLTRENDKAVMIYLENNGKHITYRKKIGW